ncbi:hypothetical protein HPB50_008429 [Hyalomma asiaticum]|uniref:Uncharacterized protein n=1 Tax=Hyalomma asiaticum TaxID=266040 RepID=A0ACB7T9C4_HYAAI|nr:hypothetical protein HPB50_008429 [Hyalomma asiaticum]
MHEVRRAIQECNHDRRVRIVDCAIVPEEDFCTRDSKTIKEINVTIDISPFDYRWVHDALFRSVSNLCEALSSSTSVTSIELACSPELRDEDYRALADALKKNRQLRKVTLHI